MPSDNPIDRGLLFVLCLLVGFTLGALGANYFWLYMIHSFYR